MPASPGGFGGIALAYNTRSRNEVMEVLDRARGAGGFSGYVTDPEGHLWEVAFNPFWSVDETGHTALGAADQDEEPRSESGRQG